MGAESKLERTDEEKWSVVDRILRGDLTPERACRERGLTREELEEWVRGYRRAARRAVDRQIAAELSAHGLDLDSASEFFGTLDEMSITELVQTIQYGRRDAEIRLEWEGERGYIWCVQGDIVDGQCGRLEGSAAVYRLLGLRHGHVQAVFSAPAHPRQIEASTQALLLESAKRFDECNQLRERIGDVDLVYVGAGEVDEALESRLAEVLMLFDGVRSIERIVHDSPLPDLETLDAICRLLEARRLTIKGDRDKSQATPALLSDQPGSSGFELSFMPLAKSLLTRPARGGRSVTKLWGGALAGVLAVAGAFAIGYSSARYEPGPRGGNATNAAAIPELICPAGMAGFGGFCLAEREVNVAEYQACVSSGACEAAPQDLALTCNAEQSGSASFPVNCVSFEQARRYCEWRGARIPTDLEWSLAAARAPQLDLTGGLAEWAKSKIGSRVLASGASESVLRGERHVVLGGPPSSTPPASPSGLDVDVDVASRSAAVGFRCAFGPELERAVPTRRQ
jgi:hypothetical protein